MKKGKSARRPRRRLGGITDIPPPRNPHEAALTVTYWAISILSSRTVWLNVGALLIAILSLSELLIIIPPRFLPFYSAVVAILNLFLRVITVRPVAFIAPGASVPVLVARLEPSPPPIVSD